MPDKPTSTSQPTEYEPFGQTGMRQLVGPAIVLVSLSLATASALMWHRSMSVADIFMRNAIVSELSIRSVYGRIVIADFDWKVDLGGAAPPIAWVYETRQVPDDVGDGWDESWMKTIGIEWRGEPYYRAPGVRGGWWIRVRWRTIMLLTIVPPIVHILRQRRLNRR